MHEDDQYILLEIPFNFPQKKVKFKNKAQNGDVKVLGGGGTNNTGHDASKWFELSQKEITTQFSGCRKYNENLVRIITTALPNLTHLQTYYLMQVGSREDYWYETRIDVERLKMTPGAMERTLRGLSSKTRLEMLSDALGGYKTLLANKISSANRDSLIIGFGSKAHDLGAADYPTIFMLVVEIEDLFTGPSQDVVETDSIFNQATRSVTNNFGKLLMYHSKLMAMHNIGYMDANKRVHDIKSKAQRMQRRINNLIQESQKVRREKESFMVWSIQDSKDRHKTDYDEGLLYNTSIYFSNITELLQTVSNAIYMAKENTQNLSNTANSMSFKAVHNPLTIERSEHISLIDEFKRFSEQVTHSFESLKIEIEGTQTSLSNTVDVLKTFLEGKQRQSSSQSGKILGLLTIVFACFVFIDMLSNFFIFYLESERTVVELSEMVIFMIITLMVPMIMFVILYFGYLKKIYDF
jgi:hypothetical protein